MLPCPAGADNVREDVRQSLRLENPKGAVMPGLHAVEIVGEFLESSDDWPDLDGDEAEPDLDLPPLPPPPPSPADAGATLRRPSGR
jgi:hypothetical protein